MADIAFPRGGRSAPSAMDKEAADNNETSSFPTRRERPSEITKKRKALESGQTVPDFLFGGSNNDKQPQDVKSKSGAATSSKKARTTTLSSSSSSKQSLLPLGGGGVILPQRSSNAKNKSTAPIIQALSFQRLHKGTTKLLATVTQVQDEFAVVSLPNLLSGFMLLPPPPPASSTSSVVVRSMKQCVQVGQVLTVAVVKVASEQLPGGATKKRIQVSGLPTHVNPRTAAAAAASKKSFVSTNLPLRGQILSVEDHGCLIDLGLGRKGFCKFDDIQGGEYHILLDEAADQASSSTLQNKKRIIILQAGRLYDFYHTKAWSQEELPTVIPLQLRKTSQIAQDMMMPPATTNTATSKQHATPYTLHSLLPGMMVTTKVEALAKNGVCVTFLGNLFRGAIEYGSHLGGGCLGMDNTTNNTNGDKKSVVKRQDLEHGWKNLLEHYQHFPARIIAIDTSTKLIRLSIAPHILTMKLPLFASIDEVELKEKEETTNAMTVGKIIEDCTVVRVDPGIGALLALPQEHHYNTSRKNTTLLPKRLVNKSDLFANETFQKAIQVPTVYVHISKAFDIEGGNIQKKKGKGNNQHHEAHTGKFAKEFGLGSQHKVRILNTSHWMDGIASGGCAPSILEAHVLTHQDLQPGQVYKQVPICAKLQGGSILVNLGGSPGNPVRGLIPSPLHLMDKMPSSSSSASDFRKQVLDTKFAVDAKVDVRVLWVDHAKKRCVVTAKKSLVKMNETDQQDDKQVVVVTSYEDLQVGQVSTGFISKMDDRALYVTFCNRVYGKVTAKSLASELGMENHLENYQVGDVLTCRVVKVAKNPRGRRPLEEDDVMEDDEGDSPETGRAYYQVLLSLNVQGEGDLMEEDDEDDDVEKSRKEQVDVSKPQRINIKAGAIVPEKSMKIVELFKGKPSRRGKGFVPGYAIVSIKSKYLLDNSEQSQMLPQMECKLPFDQLLDDFDPTDIETAESLDTLAARTLRVGKKINQKAIVLTDPHKTNVDHSSGIGKLTVLSLRKSLIASIEGGAVAKAGTSMDSVILPSPSTSLFVGALVKGYVAQIDERHGAFLRFLDGMTGLIPRMNGGLDLMPYSTIVAKIQVVDDTVKPYRIMLQPVTGARKEDRTPLPYKVGDKIAKAQITAVQFLEARIEVSETSGDVDLSNVSFQMHASMKASKDTKIKLMKKAVEKGHIVKGHPFYGLKPDDKLKNLTVVAVTRSRGRVTVQLSDREDLPDNENNVSAPTCARSRSELKAGMTVSAVVSQVGDNNKGLAVMVSPTVRGFIPGLELSTDLEVLNNIAKYVPEGARLTCVVMDDSQWHENRAKVPFASRTQKSWSERKSTPDDKRELYLSVLAVNEPTLAMEKPSRNDLIIGRVNKKLPQYMGPSLMLTLRGGFLARCCITELAECDEWENMPLGKANTASSSEKDVKKDKASAMDVDEESDDESAVLDETEEQDGSATDGEFSDGKYVQCRVLKSIPKQSLVEASLRESRIEGDLEDDEAPPEGETVQGFVIETNKKGCFIRLARHIDGRATLTELCDGFLPDPKQSFPPGRLIVGKVKSINSISKSKSSKSPARFNVDLDMRETTLLDRKKLLKFEDIELNSKHKGTVTRIESYGVFVQIENSKLSGLVHLSECSDNFVKNLASMYDPGDLVKILVIKKDSDEKRLGFSMKASHFAEDEDSDDSSSVDEDENSSDDEDAMDIEHSTKDADSDLESDDENFAAKLACKINGNDDDELSSSDEADGDGDDDEEMPADIDDESSEDSSDESEDEKATTIMNTAFKFDWGTGEDQGETKKSANESDSSDSDVSDSEEEEEGKGNSHKSRKKQSQRRQEEREISQREAALADGTADDNPETAGDFERLLAGNPNSSELWIRYMAFHLSLADVAAARMVAEKAIERIEFREEREKLNVWTALLTLEQKYGTEDSLKKTIERACGQNNPKQVYLRVCEILEKDTTTAVGVARADAMYKKMCSKFKSKKKVWLANLTYLLKQSRNDEAHALLKRALLSLPSYKHAEIMSKFAQLEYEYGSAERARTLFDGIIAKYPKRLDLFYIYVDKEVKFGTFPTARSLLQTKVDAAKMTDKQVKGLFKKWFRLEEEHGNEESMEHVKDCARRYVERNSGETNSES